MQHPTHVYAEAGSYTVTLTVTADDGGQDTVSELVVVSDATAADVGVKMKQRRQQRNKAAALRSLQ